MKSLYLNRAGDLEFDGLNNLKMVEGNSEVRQRLWIAILTNQGEWFLNSNFGVPWMELLGDKNDEEDIKQAILVELKQDAAVKEVDDLALKYDNQTRALTIIFAGKLVDGSFFDQEVVF